MSDLRAEIREARLIGLIKKLLEEEKIIISNININYSHDSYPVRGLGSDTLIKSTNALIKFDLNIEGYINDKI